MIIIVGQVELRKVLPSWVTAERPESRKFKEGVRSEEASTKAEHTATESENLAQELCHSIEFRRSHLYKVTQQILRGNQAMPCI